MKHPSTLAYYGALMMIIVQILRTSLFYFMEYNQLINYFLTLIDLFGMSLIANFFYKLHLQNKQKLNNEKPTNEFKE
jgi:low affinity Fe/Cu permease